MAVGDHSQLNRFQPRYAAVASTSRVLKHAQQVARINKQVNRRKLPRTQQDFNKQRQAARR